MNLMIYIRNIVKKIIIFKKFIKRIKGVFMKEKIKDFFLTVGLVFVLCLMRICPPFAKLYIIAHRDEFFE